jgi:hypothetical protein
MGWRVKKKSLEFVTGFCRTKWAGDRGAAVTPDGRRGGLATDNIQNRCEAQNPASDGRVVHPGLALAT